jgi:hypothetical protein
MEIRKSVVSLALLYLFSTIEGFKWHVNDSITPYSVVTYSERFMFATKNGPTMLQQGESYIHVMNTVEAM